jgi:hypothetical protein
MRLCLYIDDLLEVDKFLDPPDDIDTFVVKEMEVLSRKRKTDSVSALVVAGDRCIQYKVRHG